MAPRNHTLDGLRGCLAVLVLVSHVTQRQGSTALFAASQAAVYAFFVISAYVLTRAWDGHFLAFLLRRVVRLWPVCAVCLVGGYAMLGVWPPISQLVWLSWPLDPPAGDPPVWSLIVEIWAMLLMPIFVRVGRANALWLGIALAGTYVAALMCPVFLFAAFFFIGAWLSRFDIRLPLLGAALPQWLGRISYPLYLCHVPLIAFTGLPLWASVPLSFGVAAILTETVEKWSIKASRSRPARLLFSVGHA